ncbi:complement C5 isoform X2 [Colossoma macropomum]|uniref:complement C5 isoform X2 n=1 Tax=Colossoma macropomum TaxID=42526 RepID=UPI0018655F0C|nr:complement C5 isoform X2 [Colossoma macropomum]
MMGLLFLLCVMHVLWGAEAQERTYLITAPKLWRVDSTETVLVQLFGYDQETTVNLYIKDSLAKDAKIFASQTVKLNAQNYYQAAATLRIFQGIRKEDTEVYLEAMSGSFSTHIIIPLSRENGFLFIQTDKPLYTPEQKVEVRVYSFSEELRRSNRPVTLTFMDPDGIKIEMIELTDINGVKPLLPPFKIPLKPKFGVWKIEAAYTKDFSTTATAEFEVKEYVLPSISVRIQPEANFVSTVSYEAFKLKILAKYISGAVVDSAEVFLKFGYISNHDVVMIPSTLRRYTMYNGELNVVLDIKRALSKMGSGPQDLSEMKDHFLRVLVLLQESTGGISQEAVLSNIKFVDAPFTLSLIATPAFIKPTLPYSIRVLVKDPLGEPIRGVPVKARGTLTNTNQEQEPLRFFGYLNEITQRSQQDGVTYFICNIPSNAAKAEFTFETADQQYPPDSQAHLQLRTEVYQSVNQRYLYIDLPSDLSSFEVDDYANIKIHFSYRDYLPLKTFSYQVISKGKVVKFATEQRVSEKSQNINFKITADMVPSARLLVYYILSGEQRAELVADSVWLDIKAKCVNGLDVNLVSTDRDYKPKDMVQLSVTTKSGSQRPLVALSAVDKALYDLRANDKDPMTKVLRHIEHSDLGCGGGGGRNNIDVFYRTGLTFLTNANVKASTADEACTAVVRPKRSTIHPEELLEELKVADDIDETALQSKRSTTPLSDQFEERANQYGVYKLWCLAGTDSSPTLESCLERTKRLTTQDKTSKKVFYDCCNFAQELRAETSVKIILSGRESKPHETAVRTKRSTTPLNDQFEEKANQYGVYKLWCLAGTESSPTLESCLDRTKRLTTPDRKRKKVFYDCCNFAQELRAKAEEKITLSRSEVEFLLDIKTVQVRSYFPESWLWEEHEIDRSGSHVLTKSLPDSLTTWEMKAVGVFNNGICLADPVEVRVSQAQSIDVPLPYSMVRGEQIELKGSVYNKKNIDTTFRVTLSASDGVCVFHGTLWTDDGDPHVNKGKIGAHSVALVRFFIMALEAGTHELTFTLSTRSTVDTVVKKLRVVPEGVRKEIWIGGRLDPQGVYGKSANRVELRNSLPPNLVPKSTVDRLLIVNGEVLGELLSIITDPKGIMQLINLPRGSAEVELLGLLPVFYVYDYLERTEQWGQLGTAVSSIGLKRKIKEGITSIMSFKLEREHGFSLWKNKEPSTWLTALVVRTLAQVDKYVTVDHDILSNTIRWLITQCQNPDGSFSEKSSYKPKRLMGAGADVTERTVYLTSFVVIGIKNALTVPKSNLQIYQDALERAVQYLSLQVPKLKSLYVRAIAAYAMTLIDLNSWHAVNLYEKLKKESQIKGSPVIVRFWQEKDAPQDPLKPNKATALTVETTVYILLSTLLRGDITYAKPIVNWLTQDQRYGGGFFSTQDAILTLEAVTKYRILAQKAFLQMEVDVSYRSKGTIGHISLSQSKPVGKPIEVAYADDVILKTAFSSGVSFANLRTVYYETIQKDENCHFDLSIDVHPRDPAADEPMKRSPRIVACAKYKPHENEVELEAGHTVMEINLPTGVSPVLEDLKRFRDGLESRISDYEINGNVLVLQMDSIPSDEFYCVGFRIQEVFQTGMNSASLFKVYEYHDPDNQCSKFYYTQSRRLLRLCSGTQCQCMAAECCKFKASIDDKITAKQKKEDVCRDSIKYAFKVKITSTTAEGDFLTYNANVEQTLKKGSEDIKKDSEIGFVKKATCSSTNLEIGKQYLIMGAEIMQLRVNRSYKYKFPLDSQASVEWWPTDFDCLDSRCRDYVNVLNDFEFDFTFEGCNGT